MNKVVHYGEEFGCRREKNKRVRALCNYYVLGRQSNENFTTNIKKVTCKRCLKYIDKG